MFQADIPKVLLDPGALQGPKGAKDFLKDLLRTLKGGPSVAKGSLQRLLKGCMTRTQYAPRVSVYSATREPYLGPSERQWAQARSHQRSETTHAKRGYDTSKIIT